MKKRASYPTIDIHSHVAFPEVLELAKKIKISGSQPGKQHWVPKSALKNHAMQSPYSADSLYKQKPRIKDMDAMGIDMQVISMNLPTQSYWASGEVGHKITRKCNECIADFIALHPNRFIGAGVVPLQDQKRTSEELDYLVSIGLKCVNIPSHVRSQDLGIRKYRKFWAKAEKLRIPVYIHPRGFTHDERLHEYFLWNSIGQPLEETLAMASIIYEGILDDFPNLKIIIAHGGGYLPYYSGRTDKAYISRPETRKNISRLPSKYLSKFYYDTVIFDNDMLSLLIKKVGINKVMMGTDYPRGEVENNPIRFIEKTSNLSRDRKDKIIGLNAAKLFNINI